MANNGIIDQIVDAAAIDQLEKLKKELAENSAGMQNLAEEARLLNVELDKISTMKDLLPLLERNRKLLDATTAAERERIRILNQIQATEARLNASRTGEARRLEELRQKIAGNNRELRNQVREQQAASGSIDGMRSRLSLLQKAYDAMSATIRNSAVGKKAAEDIRKLSDEIKKLEHQTGRDQRNVGNYFGAIKKGLLSLVAVKGINDMFQGLKNIASEAINIAAKAEGVVTAFNKLSNPDLLNSLREQTKGTVSDLDLMTAAVKADMFKIPADKLGSLLKFAQQRAQETGQSVNYLTESIINGLGRKSPLILDNLGISAAALREKVKDSGDFVSGAIELINGELEKQGTLALTAADRQQQASVKWENAMLHIGGRISWMGELWNSVSGNMADGIVKIVDLFAKYAKQITVAGIAIVTYMAIVKRAAIWQAAWNTAVKAGWALAKAFPALSLLWGAAISLLTGNIRGATYAWRLFTASLMTNPVGLILTALAAAVVLFSSFTKKTNESAKAMNKFNDELNEEKSNIDSLFNALKKTNAGTSERKKLIDEINSKYGKYLTNQLTEKSTLEDIEQAHKNVTKAMAENLAFKARGEQIAKFQEDVTKANEKFYKEVEKLAKTISGDEERGLFRAMAEQLAKSESVNRSEFQQAHKDFGGEINKYGFGDHEINTFRKLWKAFDNSVNKTKEFEEQTKKLNTEWQSYINTLFPEETKKESVVQNINDEIKTAEENIKSLKKQLDDLKIGIAPADMTGTFAEAIKAKQKELDDEQQKLETLTGKSDKSGKQQQAAANAAQKRIDEVDKRIKDVQKKIADLQFESVSEPLKKVAEDEKRSLQERLEALQQYYGELQLMRDIQYGTDETAIDAKIIEARAKNETELVERLETEKTETVRLHALERQKIEEEYHAKIDDIQEKQAKKQLETLKGNIKEFQDALEVQQMKEENELAERYRKGKIKQEQYEKEKLAIEIKYSQMSLQIELDLMSELLNIEHLTEEEREKIREEMRRLDRKNEKAHLDALAKMRQKEIDEEKERKRKLEDAKKQIQQEAWNFAETMLSAQFEKHAQRYDAEIERINERKDAEIKALEQSGKTEEEIAEGKMVLEARAEAQTKNIEKRKREMQIRQAHFEKALAITEATVEGAVAVVKALKTSRILAIITAGAVALQIASILAQPIPAYAKGTDDHAGGPALVGDAYRREVVIEPSGRTYLTPDTPTIMNLAKHSVVLPSIDEMFKPDMRIFGHSQSIEAARARAIEVSFNAAVDGQTKKLDKAIRDSQSELSVNLDSHGIYRISRNGESFVRFTGNCMRYR
jgi:hypothetical protein